VFSLVSSRFFDLRHVKSAFAPPPKIPLAGHSSPLIIPRSFFPTAYFGLTVVYADRPVVVPSPRTISSVVGLGNFSHPEGRT